jgi:hypothetical protein
MRKFYFKRYQNTPVVDGDPPVSPPPPPTTFTQEQLNTFLAKEKKAWAAKLEEITKSSVPADTHKAALAELEEIKKQSMTVAEREKMNFEAQIKRQEAEAKKYKDELDATAAKLQSYKIGNGLLAAAQSTAAYRPAQLQNLFSNATKLVPVLDKEGKPTGEEMLQLTVTLDGKEIAGTPEEVFTTMKEHPEYANLFIGKGSGGLGGSGNSGTGAGRVDQERLKNDPAYYAEQRKAGNI